MVTLVYLSNNIIQIVQGERSKKKPVIKKLIRQEIEEGSLLNGIITNEQGLYEQLQDLWKQHALPVKNVELVLNSAKITGKNVTVPKQSDKKIRNKLPLEFSDVEHQEAVVFDYDILEEKKNQGLLEIMAIMAEEDYLQSFVELFGKMGVKLSKITFARSGIRKFLRNVPQLDDKASVILLIDGNSLLGILWIDGQIAYMDKKRIFVTPGSPQFSREAVNSINKIVQLHASQKKEKNIMDIYVCGFHESDMELCRSYLTELNYSFEVGELPCDQPEAVFSAGELIATGKDINLLGLKGKKKKENTNARKKLKLLLPVVVLSACGLVLGAGIFITAAVKQHQLNRLKDYIDDPGHAESAEQYDELETQISKMNGMLKDVDSICGMIASYPLMTSQVEHQILAQAGEDTQVEFTGYSAETGALQMKTTVSNAEEINRYVDRLYDTGLFRDIQYSGYTYQKTDNNYVLDVSCFLAEDAGH